MLMFLRGFWHEWANPLLTCGRIIRDSFETAGSDYRWKWCRLFSGQRNADDYGNDVGRYSFNSLFAFRTALKALALWWKIGWGPSLSDSERQSKVKIDTVYHLKSHNAFYFRNVMHFCETVGRDLSLFRGKLVEELSLSSFTDYEVVLLRGSSFLHVFRWHY